MKKRFYKKYVYIEKVGNIYKAYYNDCSEEFSDMYCGQYSKSYTRAEIKEDVVKNLTERFS